MRDRPLLSSVKDPKTPSVGRRICKRVFKFAVGLVLAVVLPVVLYLVFAVILGLVPYSSTYHPPEHGIEIFVASNGVHVDFVVPLRTQSKDWSKLLPRTVDPQLDPPARYLALGWGDRGFYLETPTWDDLEFSTALRAIFLPSRTVMHVQYLDLPPLVSSDCKRLVVSEQQYSKLAAHIEQSFARDRQGHAELIAGRGYGVRDDFYEARGTYHLFHTCNNWTNRGLKEMGVPSPLWSPFSLAILYHLEMK